MLPAEFAEAVYQNLAKNKEEAAVGFDRVSVGALAEDAVSLFAQRMIHDPARSDLEKVYSVALDITGTTASLTTHTDMLVDSLRVCNNIQHVSVPDPFIFLERIAQLRQVLTTSKYGYVVLSSNVLYLNYPAGVINAASNLLVTAVYRPTLASFPTKKT